MKKFKIISIIFVSVLLSFLFIRNSNFFNKAYIGNINYIEIAGQKLKVELASDEKTRERGLSGRTSLGEQQGMLFVFDYPGKHSFWMKEMNFPIDIIWIGENFNVVYIKKDAKPDSYPESFIPSGDAKYALEVNTDFSNKNNLKEGDIVRFLP